MKVIFTVDTEPSIAGYFKNKNHTPLIDKPVSGDIDGKSEALGFLIRLFTEYGFKATFFTETVHNCYFSDHKMGHYVDLLKKADQDIQLHLHPVWKSFEHHTQMSDMCHMHHKDFLVEIMNHGKELIKKWTGDYPVALRTGNFSAGENIYDAMSDADLKIASNICLACFQPENSDYHYINGAHLFKNIHEVPATSFYVKNITGKTTLRPLQITSIGHYEMIDILSKMQKNGHSVAVIVTHPFEFIKKQDYRYNKMRINHLVQKRAHMLCDYLAKNKDRFDVVSFSDLSINSLTNAAYIPEGNFMHGLFRSFENVMNDYIL